MNPFEMGDPYIEWNEENSAKESYEIDDVEFITRIEEGMFMISDDTMKYMSNMPSGTTRLMGEITGDVLNYIKTTSLRDKPIDAQILWIVDYLKTHSDVKEMTRDDLLLFIALLTYKLSEGRIVHESL